MNARRIVVGLSGGVDSAVAAWLLKQQGHDVVGLFMKNWEDDDDEYCSTREDLIDAAAVADVVGIDIEAVNFSAEYKDRVFSSFLAEYRAGRTPNPDVLCNAEIKFKAFLDHALRLGADEIATGHYARVDRDADGRVRLLKGVDPNKDQSYFLHRLTQAQLARAVFPLGGMHKSNVRRLAERIGLPNARKKDSTGICFIGERPFRDFLNRYLPTTPGPIRTSDGEVVGQHVGLAFYTLGQRKGIGIGGVRGHDDAEGAWFVARKDMATNTLWIVRGHDHPWLQSTRVVFGDASWVDGSAPATTRLSAKTRYRQADAPCRFERDGQDRWALAFDDAQRAVTPGQSAVLYDGDVCLGGGVIVDAQPLTEAIRQDTVPGASRKAVALPHA